MCGFDWNCHTGSAVVSADDQETGSATSPVLDHEVRAVKHLDYLTAGQAVFREFRLVILVNQKIEDFICQLTIRTCLTTL